MPSPPRSHPIPRLPFPTNFLSDPSANKSNDGSNETTIPYYRHSPHTHEPNAWSPNSRDNTYGSRGGAAAALYSPSSSPGSTTSFIRPPHLRKRSLPQSSSNSSLNGGDSVIIIPVERYQNNAMIGSSSSCGLDLGNHTAQDMRSDRAEFVSFVLGFVVVVVWNYNQE